MSNYNQGIYIIRHGARTSSSIGRLGDFYLNSHRKGLTMYGYSQLYFIGKKFREFIKKNNKKCI